MSIDNSGRVIFNTKSVEEVTKQLSSGYKVKRHLNPWFEGKIGIRKAGLAFAPTREEYAEYIRCATDIHHYSEKYCKIKTEDGEILNMKLRPYQKDILDLIVNNRFSILMASRQCGKCLVPFHQIDYIYKGELLTNSLFDIWNKFNGKKRKYDCIRNIIYKLLKLLC